MYTKYILIYIQVYMFADDASRGETMTMKVVQVSEGEHVIPPELNTEVLKDYSPDEERIKYEKKPSETVDFSDFKSSLDRLMKEE